MARKLIAVNPILAEWLAPTLRLRSNVKLKHSSGVKAVSSARKYNDGKGESNVHI